MTPAIVKTIVRVVSVPADERDGSRDWKADPLMTPEDVPLHPQAGKSFVAHYTLWDDGARHAEYLNHGGTWTTVAELAIIPDECWFVTE